MAAVASTASTRVYNTVGQLYMVSEDITSVDDTDTWDSGLRTVTFATFTSSTANPTATEVHLSWSGGTVTFDVESGTLAGTIVAWGS